MASNSKSTTLYPQSGYGYTLYCGFSEENLTQEQIGKNVTKINANGYLKANGTYWATSHVSSLVLYWHDNKENKDIEIARNDFAGFNSTSDSRSVSASFEISHKDDGTLSGYVWISFTKGNAGAVYAPASGSVGTDWTALTTVPRATSLANQSGTIAQPLTISWTKASKDFTHKLTYSFGNIADEVLGTNLVDGYTWQIPEKLYEQFTNEEYGKGTLKLTTYNGTTQIGSTQEAELTIYANQSLAEPVIEDILLKDINSATTALTGDNTTFVLNQSKIFLTLSFNTRKFATLKSLTVDGVSIDINQISKGTQSQDGTTSYGLQYEYGTLTKKTINFIITDTRGFAISHLLTIHDSIIIDYVSLDAVVSFKRIAPTTGEVGLEFNGKYFNGTFGNASNSLTISYKYKKSNETNYSSEFTLKKDTDYKISGNTYYSGNGSSKQTIKLAPNFDYKSQYDVQLTIKDKLTTLPTISVIITKGIPIMWWNGEKVTINGDLYVADENGENAVNVKNLGGSAPIGEVSEFAGKNIPDGWMICDGRELPRTDYAELFNAIGTTYGEGDGSTTFNIPNIKGRVVVAVDENQEEFAELGKVGGSKYLQEHSHHISLFGNVLLMNQGSQYGSYIGTGDKYTDTAGTGDSENLQPYIVLYKIIKATNIVSTIPTNVEAKVIDNLDGNSTTDAPSVRAVKELKSKKEVLWTGSFSPTANNTYRYMTLEKNVYDYDFLLIDVSSGTHLTDRTTVTLTIEGKGVKCAVRGDLFYLTESYRFTFGVETDGLNEIGFKVQSLTQYALSDIKMHRIMGVKL